MEIKPLNADPALDPRLQRIVHADRHGRRPAAASSTSAGEAAIVARIKDPELWKLRTDVTAGANLGGRAGDFIVTGRVPVDRLEALRRDPNVLSLKAAQPVQGLLRATTADIRATLATLPTDALGSRGQGVLVGVVDFGCDFAHANFRRADGSSRIVAIWDQTGAARPDSPFGYGRLHTTEQIDAALASARPYDALRYEPAPRSHGTHVLDIAAGNGLGSGTEGVAPAAEIAFVELAASDITFGGPGVIGKTFGDSVHLLEAVRFLFDLAGDRPCVVNLSLGMNGGSHDGTSLVEQGLDRLVEARPGRAVVISASNSYADGIHAAGQVNQGAATDLQWVISDGDFTYNEIEVWYPGSDEFGLEFLAPDGTSVGHVALGQNGIVRDAAGATVFFISHRRSDPNNNDHCINIFLESSAAAGTWTLRLTGVNITNGGYHAWIERDDAAPSSFAPPHDNSRTLGSISCGHHTLVVGSYDAHKPALPLSYFSSAGPTRDGREKPELSAPGHDVLAAAARTGDGITRMSGTSMAAPAVTGAVALVLAEARARALTLDHQQIRTALLATARSGPGAAWDPRLGKGRLAAASGVAAVISGELGAAPPLVEAAPPGPRLEVGDPSAFPDARTTAALAAGDIDVIVKVARPDYVPPRLNLRSHIAGQIMTGSVTAADFEALQNDPLVSSVEGSRAVRSHSDR